MKKITELPNQIYDELIIGVFESREMNKMFKNIDRDLDGELSKILEYEVTGKLGEITTVHTFGKINSKKIVLLGLGDKESFTNTKLKKAIIYATKYIKGENKQVAICLELSDFLSSSIQLRTISEAFNLANYRYTDQYTVKNEEAVKQLTVFIDGDGLKDAEKGLKLGGAISEGVYLTRYLTDLPANLLTPTNLKDEIVNLAKRYGMEYDVLKEKQLKELGMGGILGVAQGSSEQPYVVTVKYEGAPNSDETVGLIGKGVTFDSGGLSLKNKNGLEILKKDMNGAATMMGVIETIGRLKPNVNVLLVIGCVENMVSGSSYRPGDVLKMMDDTTVEIISTDAEGRLVLGDCVTYAKTQGVSSMIDCASLTGAVRVALGYVAAGVMGNDQKMINEFLSNAKTADEYAWQLPLYEEYKDNLKSQVADLKNSGSDGFGGAMVAGKFIEHFVKDTPWIHLDISSSGYARSKSSLMPIGATGAMVGTITQYLLDMELND